ncbi:hypothetical protein CCF10_004571 [Escherichia fergusonii]|nr:hypothetical protein [Escherichia fergusonii]EFF0771489.1 hypothetical protein [Escherichia fergusonii]
MRLLHHATLVGLFVIPFFANAISGLTFSHKDQELACNNTGTCRAADYGDNYRFGKPLHYAFERVAVIPVWLNNKYYIGTVASHHG